MAVGLTQPLTEMGTRNLRVDKEWLAPKADNFTVTSEHIVNKMWKPRRLTTLEACKDSFTCTLPGKTLHYADPLGKLVITLKAGLSQTSSEHEAQCYQYTCDFRTRKRMRRASINILTHFLRKQVIVKAGGRNRVRIVCNGWFCEFIRNPEN
jgi:hypothetical protein